MVRKAVVAGQFYPGTEEELRHKIEDCFKHPLGPGSLPEKKGNSRAIKAVVAPHAGYTYSGPVAAHVYDAIVQDGVPDVFVVIGPNHNSFGAAIASEVEDFETPLGAVKVDSELVKKLQNDLVRIDRDAHAGEHSLEVQMPFIRYISDEVQVVPLCMTKQDYDTSVELGNLLRSTLRDRDAVIIASTDFSHYVLKEVAEKRDMLAIEKIIENDPRGFFSTVMKEHISMCGYGPVLAAMIGSGYSSAELLKYATSGDVMPMRDVVGYAAMVLR